MNKEEEETKRKLVVNNVAYAHIPRPALSARHVEKVGVYRLIRLYLLVAKEI